MVPLISVGWYRCYPTDIHAVKGDKGGHVDDVAKHTSQCVQTIEKAHAILKIWGDAPQTITSHKASSPPTLKSWWFYRWNRFRQRTDKWGLLQWYLVILGIIACVLFSSLYQNRVMNLDRTNRIFYKKVIMDEKRKKNYHELDSLIHSDSFFKTYWELAH